MRLKNVWESGKLSKSIKVINMTFLVQGKENLVRTKLFSDYIKPANCLNGNQPRFDQYIEI